MIYLFEDRKDRMAQYLKSKLDNTLIREALFDSTKENLNDYLKENYSDASAIIFHLSYIFSNKSITNEDIKGYFVKSRIPFVYFSGGLGNNLIPENGILNGNVNSGDMYNNLIYFINDFSKNKEVNIPLLVYGQKHILNSFLELQYLITIYLFDKPNNYIISKLDFNTISDFLDVRLKESEFQKNKLSLTTWLNNRNTEDRLPSKVILLDQIQKMIEKY